MFKLYLFFIIIFTRSKSFYFIFIKVHILKHLYSFNRKFPQKILLSHVKTKPSKIYCGPDTSAVLFTNGEIHVCGSNDYNKLGFQRPSKITAFVRNRIKNSISITYILPCRRKSNCLIRWFRLAFRPLIRCSWWRAAMSTPWVEMRRASVESGTAIRSIIPHSWILSRPDILWFVQHSVGKREVSF